MQVRDSVVIVTGSSAGIGRATSEALAQAGANVVLTARRAERLEQLVAGLEAHGGRCLAVTGDIREEAFAQELVRRTVDVFGRLDALVNNAGIGHKSTLAEMPTADIHTVFDTNVMGLLYVTRAAVPVMQRQGRGQIVNVSSIIGHQPLPYSGVYCASKTAVNFLSRALRMELRSCGITVTLVHTGLTATEFADARLGQKGGNRFGLRGIPAARVGRAIVKAIEKNRSDVYVTLYDWFFVHVCRHFPGTVDWLVTRGMSLA